MGALVVHIVGLATCFRCPVFRPDGQFDERAEAMRRKREIERWSGAAFATRHRNAKPTSQYRSISKDEVNARRAEVKEPLECQTTGSFGAINSVCGMDGGLRVLVTLTVVSGDEGCPAFSPVVCQWLISSPCSS